LVEEEIGEIDTVGEIEVIEIETTIEGIPEIEDDHS
jgi:hypothetical protein